MSLHAAAASAVANSTAQHPFDFPEALSEKNVKVFTRPYAESTVSNSASVVHHVNDATYTAVGRASSLVPVAPTVEGTEGDTVRAGPLANAAVAASLAAAIADALVAVVPDTLRAVTGFTTGASSESVVRERDTKHGQSSRAKGISITFGNSQASRTRARSSRRLVARTHAPTSPYNSASSSSSSMVQERGGIRAMRCVGTRRDATRCGDSGSVALDGHVASVV